jgi:hypothetical protein
MSFISFPDEQEKQCRAPVCSGARQIQRNDSVVAETAELLTWSHHLLEWIRAKSLNE